MSQPELWTEDDTDSDPTSPRPARRRRPQPPANQSVPGKSQSRGSRGPERSAKAGGKRRASRRGKKSDQARPATQAQPAAAVNDNSRAAGRSADPGGWSQLAVAGAGGTAAVIRWCVDNDLTDDALLLGMPLSDSARGNVAHQAAQLMMPLVDTLSPTSTLPLGHRGCRATSGRSQAAG